MIDELHYLTLLEVAGRIRDKELTSVEATEAAIGRIEQTDGALKAFARQTPDRALDDAKAADKEIAAGRYRGPLHGVPIALKDLCRTKDIVTAAGMPLHGDYVPDYDATVTKRLADAGAVLLGKLQMTEGAFADHHPDITPPVNPWNADHWPGVSSSGSGVATAAGLCYASLGSDTGGSIRFPSAANGVTGLKPTWGRVSRHGVFDLAPTLDHIGPMCRSAADTGAVLGVIAGADPSDPTTLPDPVPDYLEGLEAGLGDLRIGVDPKFNAESVDDEMRRTVEGVLDVLRGMGADIREVTFPDPGEVVQDWLAHCGVETAVAHKETYPAQKDRYGPGLAGLIDVGRDLSGEAFHEILLRRHAFSGRLKHLFDEIDLLVIPAQYMASPTVAHMATLGEDPNGLANLLRFTCPFDMSGSPTITLPSGFTDGGMPIAFQFVAGHLQEGKLVRAGHAFQRETDWHKRHPNI